MAKERVEGEGWVKRGAGSCNGSRDTAYGLVYGLWSMVFSLRSIVYGLWSMVDGSWLVEGQSGHKLWSMIYDLWSMVYGLWRAHPLGQPTRKLDAVGAAVCVCVCACARARVCEPYRGLQHASW